MQQIKEMASAMGINADNEEITADAPFLQDTLQQVSQVLHQTEAKSRRQQTLMRALLPYLSPGRQAKLERAMQLSNLSRLAGAALQSSPMSSILSEEELHV